MAISDYLRRDVDLSRLNTLRLPARARYFAVVHRREQLFELSRWQAERAIPWRILGGGSNLLLPDHFDGLLLAMGLRGFSAREEADFCAVDVDAGESWHDVVRRTLANGWYGLENLALIPGSAGAAPIQNIGAYGGEIASCLQAVEVFWWRERRFELLSANRCGFGYRDSRFKHEWAGQAVVTRLSLRLAKTEQLRLQYADVQNELGRMGISKVNAQHLCEAVIRVRRRKLPEVRQYGNVGSFFKNPVLSQHAAAELFARDEGLAKIASVGPDGIKVPAAALIDRAGLKGIRLGAVGTWPRQPLVLVNYGGARRDQVLALAERIKQGVAQRFQVELEQEPENF